MTTSSSILNGPSETMDKPNACDGTSALRRPFGRININKESQHPAVTNKKDRSNCKALKNPNMKTRLVGLKENKTIDDENRETPVEVSTVEHQTIDLVATNTSTSSSSEVDCSVFRRTSSLDDTTDDTGIESMWTLKRANTFFDEDEDCSSSSDESPLKRLRSNTVLRHDIQTKYAPTTSFNFANNNVFRLELNGTSGQFHIS